MLRARALLVRLFAASAGCGSLGCGSLLVAQSAVALTDANALFAYTAYPTTPTSTAGLCTFAAAGVDHAYQSWWYYAVQGDTRGTAFNTAGGQMTATVAADARSVAFDWANVDTRSFAARLNSCVYSTGTTSGVSAQAMTITNNTGAPLTISVYSYTDLDVAGVLGDSATQQAGWPTGNHLVQDSGGVQCWAMGSGFSNYAVAAFPAVRDNVLNGVGGAPYVPGNTGLPFGPGDYSGVFHWLLTLAPGASNTVSSLLAITQVPSSQRIASSTTFCIGKPGTHGQARWTLNRPFCGASTSLRIENGLPGSAPIVFLGTASTALPIAPFGTLCTVPVTTLAMPLFDAMRVSAAPITIPNVAALGAAPLFWQGLFLDPGAAASLAHTDGLRWSIGSFGN